MSGCSLTKRSENEQERRAGHLHFEEDEEAAAAFELDSLSDPAKDAGEWRRT